MSKNPDSVAEDDGPTAQSHSFDTAITPEGVVQSVSRREESSSDDEYRRFKVTIKWVADVDLEAVMEFCRADESSPSGEEECLSGQYSCPRRMQHVIG